MSGYRYGEWRGGPDPLAAPYDVAGALDALGEDVLDGATPREAWAFPAWWRWAI